MMNFKSMAFALFVYGLIGVSPETSSQVPQPVGPLRVVDATGKSLGDVTDLQGNVYAWSVMKVGNLRFRLWILQLQLKSEGANAIYFESDNCTGAPFIYVIYASPDNRIFDLVEIIGNTFSLYTPTPGAVFASRTMRSNLNSDGVCSAPGPSTFINIPASKVLDLRDYFVPPFSLLEVPQTVSASVPAVEWPVLAFLSILLAAFGSLKLIRSSKRT